MADLSPDKVRARAETGWRKLADRGVDADRVRTRLREIFGGDQLTDLPSARVSKAADINEQKIDTWRRATAAARKALVTAQKSSPVPKTVFLAASRAIRAIAELDDTLTDLVIGETAVAHVMTTTEDEFVTELRGFELKMSEIAALLVIAPDGQAACARFPWRDELQIGAQHTRAHQFLRQIESRRKRARGLRRRPYKARPKV